MNNAHDFKLRTATIDDLAFLQYWDEQPHVMMSDPNDDWNWETELLQFPDWREQLIVEMKGDPLGFIQIIDPAREDSHYWGEVPENLRAIDIWIGKEENLGKGYGTIMMTMALERCFSEPKVIAVIIDPLASNLKVHRFYERIGFKFLENRRFGKDDCFVYQLNRNEWFNRTIE